MQPPSPSFHHVTAITGRPQENLDFYVGLLGLRLVKRTINFDDPSSYHLYYGDDAGSPGTLLTFFVWPGAPRGRIGPPQISEIALSVPVGALDEWAETLREGGVLSHRDGDALRFKDPEGLPLALHESASADSIASGGIRGVTLTLSDASGTGQVLTDLLGFSPAADEGDLGRYQGAGGEIAIRTVGANLRGRLGGGVVHHVAFRCPDPATQLDWRERLLAAGLAVSPVMERVYFQSIYFREPGGVLFEIATDGPGFAIDESPDALGAELKLPPWLEPRRAEITAALPDLDIPARRAVDESTA